jgi:septum formation protein
MLESLDISGAFLLIKGWRADNLSNLFGGSLRNNGKHSVHLILASNSPRRKELLRLGGLDFRILPADVDETPRNAEPADRYVLRLAETKARAVASQAEQGEWIVAADTTVADREQILGKPVDAADAMGMLLNLRGREHQVYTAVAVFDPHTGRMQTELAATNVPMRTYSRQEIQEYIATGDPFDKAGSYAIQHPEFHPVEALSGCYANVVGLPLCHLDRALRGLGISFSDDLPEKCQVHLQFDCTVYPQVQKGEI